VKQKKTRPSKLLNTLHEIAAKHGIAAPTSSKIASRNEIARLLRNPGGTLLSKRIRRSSAATSTVNRAFPARLSMRLRRTRYFTVCAVRAVALGDRGFFNVGKQRVTGCRRPETSEGARSTYQARFSFRFIAPTSRVHDGPIQKNPKDAEVSALFAVAWYGSPKAKARAANSNLCL